MTNPTDVVGKRVLQYIIDAVLIGVGTGILYLIAALLDAAFLYVVAWVLGIALAVWDFVLYPVQNGAGQTLGMKVMDLKIVMEDGSRLEYGPTFIRWILLIVDVSICFLIGLIVMITDKEKHQRIGDKVAKTLVIDSGYAGPLPGPQGYGGGYEQQGYSAPPQGGYEQQGYGAPPQQGGYQAPPPPPPGGYQPPAPPQPGGYESPPPPPPPPAQ